MGGKASKCGLGVLVALLRLSEVFLGEELMKGQLGNGSGPGHGSKEHL